MNACYREYHPFGDIYRVVAYALEILRNHEKIQGVLAVGRLFGYLGYEPPLYLIEVIVNNHVLGMVRQWQDLFYEKRYSATVLDDGVDFVKLAEAMGAKGYRVTSQEEFKEAFKEALESEVPVLIDCIINCDDKVWPMVAPGEAISSSFTGEDLAKKQQS